jgi:hypothetical protein
MKYKLEINDDYGQRYFSFYTLEAMNDFIEDCRFKNSEVKKWILIEE